MSSPDDAYTCDTFDRLQVVMPINLLKSYPEAESIMFENIYQIILSGINLPFQWFFVCIIGDCIIRYRLTAEDDIHPMRMGNEIYKVTQKIFGKRLEVA